MADFGYKTAYLVSRAAVGVYLSTAKINDSFVVSP
jgi:hypothetical protein